jgi:hypothetical protein
LERDVESVKRQRAASGRVSYGDPIILNDTTNRRVVFVPFFIPHSDHTELAGKITTYRKKLPPLDWITLEEKSLSLSGDATRKLLAALRTHLAVAKEQEDGNYLLIRVAEGTALIGEHDPAQVAAALTKVLSQPDVVEHLRDTELSSELVCALRGAIKLNEMKSAVAQLRALLESGENGEEVYQMWCESHTWAFGNAYVVRDEVRNISAGDRLDILLPSVIAGYRDLVELKRPDMPVLKYDESHRNYYFAVEVSKAIGQCHRYLDILHEVASKGLLDHPEIVAYHPRAIIVIGQSHDWGEEKLHALHGLNRRLSGITVMTYNHLLAQGERLIEMLAPKPEDTEQDMVWDEEDMPL